MEPNLKQFDAAQSVPIDSSAPADRESIHLRLLRAAEEAVARLTANPHPASTGTGDIVAAAGVAGYSVKQFRKFVAAGHVPGARQRRPGAKWTFDLTRVKQWRDEGFPLPRQRSR